LFLEYEDRKNQACGRITSCGVTITFWLIIPLLIGLSIAFGCSPNAKRYYLD
jgi:hypothetical protein